MVSSVAAEKFLNCFFGSAVGGQLVIRHQSKRFANHGDKRS